MWAQSLIDFRIDPSHLRRPSSHSRQKIKVKILGTEITALLRRRAVSEMSTLPVESRERELFGTETGRRVGTLDSLRTDKSCGCKIVPVEAERDLLNNYRTSHYDEASRYLWLIQKFTRSGNSGISVSPLSWRIVIERPDMPSENVAADAGLLHSISVGNVRTSLADCKPGNSPMTNTMELTADFNALLLLSLSSRQFAKSPIRRLEAVRLMKR